MVVGATAPGGGGGPGEPPGCGGPGAMMASIAQSPGFQRVRVRVTFFYAPHEPDPRLPGRASVAPRGRVRPPHQAVVVHVAVGSRRQVGQRGHGVNNDGLHQPVLDRGDWTHEVGDTRSVPQSASLDDGLDGRRSRNRKSPNRPDLKFHHRCVGRVGEKEDDRAGGAAGVRPAAAVDVAEHCRLVFGQEVCVRRQRRGEEGSAAARGRRDERRSTAQQDEEAWAGRAPRA